MATPTAHVHPLTGEKLLFVSEGFTTSIEDADGKPQPELLRALR